MSQVWLGVLWKIISCTCFAIVNGLVRYLSSDSFSSDATPTYVVMLYQNLIATLILLPVLLTKTNFNVKKILATKQPYLHFARVLTAVCGIGLWYLSLKYMQMTQVIAISFIAPIITIMGSTIFLHEKLSWPRCLAITLSIIGGFLISRPDRGIIGLDFSLVVFFPVLAASIFAFDKILTRKLLELGEQPNILTIYLVGSTAILCVIPFVVYGCPWPSIDKLPWLCTLGITGCLAHYSFSKAYAYAEVTFLMPFGISKFVLSALIGYFAFSEIPRTFSIWIGMIVILASTILLNLSPAKRSQNKEKPILVGQATT
ncbi:MAG: DMT family transporter [Francisellaceae bacterium]|jgi:drug/metabolite transporter (DMT)-like permease|nr:DMT family transporter [Francisellaceae bacterium]MBT6207640.1 DMT family transporter [Francisellaceae bacterium]